MSELTANTRGQAFLSEILDELRELNKNVKGLAKAGPSSPKKPAPRKGKGGKTNGTAS